MVFPSVPVYLDPPNWNQAQAHPVGANTGGGDAQQFPPPGMAPPRPEASASGTIRPNSMSERARLAKIPQPEAALKCPRCESTNTKFCYFNNYSLSQPRHFCKTCRRYWTRGGALRNVPVGGGCRRNKRSKSSGGGGTSSSKSSTATTADRQSGASSSSSSTATSTITGAIPSNLVPQPHLPFMASLHPLAGYSTANIGLNFGGMQAIDNFEYQVGSSSAGVGLEQWRIQPIQQLPFLGGMETPAQVAGLFPFDHGEASGLEGIAYGGGQVQAKASSAGLITQLASVKMEDSAQDLSLARQYLGMPRSDQFWAGSSGGDGGGGGGGGGGGSGGTSGGWTDLPGFGSSSAGNLL